MPLTRPAEISDCVSLSDKLAGEALAFVAEHGTVNSVLLVPTFVDRVPEHAVINEISPDEKSIGAECSEYDCLPRTDELATLSTVSILVG
jgi:hypothetical protein